MEYIFVINFIFGCNEGTAVMLDGMGVLSPELNDFLSKNNRRELL